MYLPGKFYAKKLTVRKYFKMLKLPLTFYPLKKVKTYRKNSHKSKPG